MRRSWRSTALATIAVLGLTACGLGERPYFEDSPTVVGTETGDAAIDAVLDLLDTVGGSMFTASYQATLKFGGVESSSTVTQIGPRRSVTIGQVRYVVDNGSSRTCRLDTGVCDDGIQAEAVSDTGLTPEFAFGDMAKRLRRDAQAKIGPSVASVVQIAGIPATCVDVVVSGGTKQYCVLSDGAIARFRGADIELELLTHVPTSDETLFAP
jgi:hypothetical protein